VCSSIRQRSISYSRLKKPADSSVTDLNRLTPQRLSFLDNPEPGVGVSNLYLETSLGPIDLLGSIKGVGEFERVHARSVEVELFGRRCRVISIEDLILAKEALNRPKDALAAQELRAIAEKMKKS
jgi:hypothetical protein